MADDSTKTLIDAFMAADTEGTGTLTPEQIKTVLTQLNVCVKDKDDDQEFDETMSEASEDGENIDYVQFVQSCKTSAWNLLKKPGDPTVNLFARPTT